MTLFRRNKSPKIHQYRTENPRRGFSRFEGSTWLNFSNSVFLRPCHALNLRGTGVVALSLLRCGPREQRRKKSGAVPCADLPSIVMACIVMAYIVMACIVMAYIVMACIVMAHIVMAYIVMAYIVMAYIVMA